FVGPSNVILSVLLVGHQVGVLLAEKRYRGRADAAVEAFVLVLFFTTASLFVLRYAHGGFAEAWSSDGGFIP
ncbi:hypothetical protein D6U55_19690, partial [Vibrio cholerae]|nr:hypothetical protein [Vibrio cholerae]